ncbi:hypothetical protein ASF62_11030 [Leifsonia sp. Leaf325]|nr:hypothetical protein ASF62_11030 [Leifsonia sp. Leaf325]
MQRSNGPALCVEDQLDTIPSVELKAPFWTVDTDELRYELVGRLREDFRGCSSLGYDPASLDDHNLVGQGECFVDVMSDEQDGLGELAFQSDQFLLQGASHDWIDSTERFVHQQDVRVGRQCSSHPDPLLLSAGELCRVPLCQFSVEAH